MKIRELIRRTDVSKETIHHYIRQGILPKPKKSGKVNVVDYNETYVDQILLIKELRENYFLPLPLIKKILRNQKNQPSAERMSFYFLSEYFRPMDRFLPTDVIGRENFFKATNLGIYWIEKIEEWGIITPEPSESGPVYKRDDVIIGRLIADMDNLGFGPKDGYDPAELSRIRDFLKELIAMTTQNYLEKNYEKLNSSEFTEKGLQNMEVMGLFFYHLYRKLVKKEVQEYALKHQNKHP